MSESIKKFIAQRAELLATLFLTRREEVEIVRLGDKSDELFDFYINVKAAEGKGNTFGRIGVKTYGVSPAIADAAAAKKLVHKRIEDPQAMPRIPIPVVVMLFSMENDEGYYGWLKEPQVQGEHPLLVIPQTVDMKPLDTKAVNEIVDRSLEWSTRLWTLLNRYDFGKKKGKAGVG